MIRSAFIFLATFGAVYAQTPALQCTANSGVPPVVRAEGTTELVGDIVVTCSIGPGMPNLLNVDVSVSFNAPVTSIQGWASSGLTEALLIIGDVAAPIQPGNTGFRAQRVQQNVLRFASVPITLIPFGTATFRITNVRVDASAIGPGDGLIPNMITAMVSVNPATFAIDNPQQPVAFIKRSVNVELRTPSNGAFIPLTLNPAAGLNASLLSGNGTGVSPQYLIRFTELIHTAFRARSSASDPAAPVPAQNVAGDVYFTESGYYDPQLTATGQWNTVGLATNGTRFLVRFAGIPAGASLYVSNTPWPLGTTDAQNAIGTGGAKLVQADADGVGAYSPTAAQVTTQIAGQTVGLTAIPVTSGSATAVWEVTNASYGSTGVLDSLSFAVFLAYNAPIQPFNVHFAQAYLAPLSGDAIAPRFSAARGTSLAVIGELPPAPTAPTLTSPQHGALLAAPGPIPLSWVSASEATSWDVYFGTSPQPPFVGNSAHSLYMIGTVNPSTTYYWYVRARNMLGVSPPSGIRSFTTRTPVAPVPGAASPSSGTGLSQLFQVTYSDGDGGVDISSAYLLIGGSVSQSSACVARFDRSTQAFRLMDDAGTTWSQPITAGPGTVSNSACMLSGFGAGATVSDDTLTVTFAVTFNQNYSGQKNLYALASDSFNLQSPGGWKVIGSWTVPAPMPDVIAIGPVNAGATSGGSNVFRAVFRHPGGQSQHYLGMMLFLPLPNVVSFNAQGTCLIEYNRLGGNFDGKGGMRLIDDAGTGWLGRLVGEPLAPTTRPLSNDACTVNVAGATAAFQGNDMIVTVPVTFNPTYVTQTMGTFIQSNSTTGQWTDFRQFGNWTVPGAPVRTGPRVMSGTPVSGAGSSTTLTITAGHSDGLNQLGEVHIRLNTSIAGGTPCHVIYSPAVNVMSMINDAGTALVGPVPLGQALTTNRCSVAAGAWRTQIGTSVTLRLPLIFNVADFGAGTKNVYVNGFDINGAVTHWVQTGTWTAQ